MPLATYDAMKGFVDASVHGMGGNAILAGDGAGVFGWCHGEDRCKRWRDYYNVDQLQEREDNVLMQRDFGGIKKFMYFEKRKRGRGEGKGGETKSKKRGIYIYPPR